MDFVLGNSLNVVHELKSEGIPEDKLKLIYNGVSEASVELEEGAQIRSELGIVPENVMMTIVANLIPYKGHMDLLEACAQLPDEKWDLVIVGDDTTGIKQGLVDFAERNHLANRVHFTGARADVSSIWAASDIGLLVSHEEGFSNALLEGMMANLPMIVTSVGGNSEAVLDGVTGIVVPPQNPTALRHAISLLLGDAGLRNAMGARARERASLEFSIDKCLKEYNNLYDQILG
jgi:glycosyltransferase involved in cell wall biosynthesis